MNTRGAQAVGIANIALDGTVLDTWYPEPALIDFGAESHDGPDPVSGTVRVSGRELTKRMIQLVKLDDDRMVEQVAVRTTIADLNSPPVDAHDAYLRMHLLSHRLVRPHELNMDGIMNHLANVVWTNKGPCLPENFEFVRTTLRSRGLIHVYCVDKLPRMVDYVVPSGVRISEAERVRLGAYLAPGTSVLREGFVSYNSGALGPCRIEGRMSAGAVIGKGTTVGLSSSIIAHRDNGGVKSPISVGENCTFGVGSGVLGINLGNDCHIGTSVILDRKTPVWFADRKELLPASSIDGQSGWTITSEAGFTEPVARQYIL